MANDSLTELVETFRRNRLLESDQLQQLAGEVDGAQLTPRELARDLVRRGWLTPYQVNQIFLGHADNLLLGSYVLLDRLGEGGMGAVYKARNWKLGRTVALKLIRKERLAHPDAVRRFHREIRAVSQLNHPNIVRAYDADEVNGTHFLVMEYVEGIDLAQRIKKQGALPPAEACAYIRQAALGLQHAHERGLVHRDIKPANLLLALSGEPKATGSASGTVACGSRLNATVKILDMGLALVAQADGEVSSTVTQEGAVMGTPDYLAPEQTLDAHNVDIRADLYSLGCSLYYLLTGSVPFPGGSLGEKLMKHQLREPRPVAMLRPDVPSEVTAIVCKLMAKKPEDRYQTPAELARVLESLAGSLSGVTVASASIAPSANGSQNAATIGLSNEANHRAELPGATTFLRETVRKSRGVATNIRRPWLVVGIVGGVLALIVLALMLIRPGNRTDTGDGKLAHKPSSRPGVNPPPVPEPVDAGWIKKVKAMPAEKQAEAVAKKLQELNPEFDGKIKHKIEGAALTELDFSTDGVSDISPLQALGDLKKLTCNGSGAGKGRLAELGPLRGLALTELGCGVNLITDLTPVAGMPLKKLNIAYTKVKDLGALKGMPLVDLVIFATPVTDLAPLKDLPLVSLVAGGGPRADLSALRGMKIQNLNISMCQVADLSPLGGMPLKALTFYDTKVRDLEPLRGLPLKSLECQGVPFSDLAPLSDTPLNDIRLHFNPWRGDRQMLAAIKTLRSINDKPAAEFLKQADADMAAFDAWAKNVARLPAKEQVEAVAAELKKRNPGFDGKLGPMIENGKVVSLSLASDAVTDIAAVRGLPELRKLYCGGSAYGKGKLADLWPIKGLALEALSLYGTEVADLSPLTGMPLTSLMLNGSRVTELSPLEKMPLTDLHLSLVHGIKDLGPLRGMRLKVLGISQTQVADLSPLRGMPLENLGCELSAVSELSHLEGAPLNVLICAGTRVTDLTPLKGMPLRQFDCAATNVEDLSPIQGAPLKHLSIGKTKVNDLSFIRRSPLEAIRGDLNVWRDSEVLRGITTLKEINGKPAAEFWKPYDDFDAWAKEVRKLPAEKQVEAVAAELKKRNPGFNGKVKATIGKSVSGLALLIDQIQDIAPVRALKDLQALSLDGTDAAKAKFSDLWPLKGMPLNLLNCTFNKVSDLTPLSGMPLKLINLRRTEVTDLSPLRKAPLESLGCNETPLTDIRPVRDMPMLKTLTIGYHVSDLRPLQGLPLKSLWIFTKKDEDLSPLKGMPLESFQLFGGKADLAPLAGMPLKDLRCSIHYWRDRDLLRSFKTLETINGKPAAEFWKPHDDFEKWCKDVATLPAKKQVEAVAAELKKRNPGVDGKVTSAIHNGAVIRLTFVTDEVTDVSPVRALTGLKSLNCFPSVGRNGKLADLWPLKGMMLVQLSFQGTAVADITPLKGMPLTQIVCYGTPVTSLEPLKGAPLVHLWCGNTLVTDLTPLEGMKLKTLEIHGARLADLTPLTGLPLENLNLGSLNLWRDPEVLRQVKSLQVINGSPAAEFWKDVNTKQAAFDAWVKDVAKLPAEKQVEAVAAELKKRNPGFDERLKSTIEKGQVTGLEFSLGDRVKDISPVRALPALKKLACLGQGYGEPKPGAYSPFDDLWPLAGLLLEDLTVARTQIADLSPLRGMPLRSLHFGGSRVSDLSPLKAMASLRTLRFNSSLVSDISVLRGLALETVNCPENKLLTDLSPLKLMPLRYVWCDFKVERDAKNLSGIPTLQMINGRPAAEVLGRKP